MHGFLIWYLPLVLSAQGVLARDSVLISTKAPDLIISTSFGGTAGRVAPTK